MSPASEENDHGDAPPTRFRRLKRVAFAILLLTIVGLLSHYTYQHRGEKVLERTIAELDRTDRDWRIEHIEANRRDLLPDKNSAVVVVKVYGIEGGPQGMLPRNWENEAIQKAFTGLEPQFQLSEGQIALLRPALQNLTPALMEARKLADLPEGRYLIDYSVDGYSTVVPHIQGARAVTRALNFDAWLLVQDGRHGEAVRSIQAGVNCGRSAGDEPLLISQLVRIGCVNEALLGLERVLAQGEPSSESLAALQKLLEAEGEHNAILVAFRGDRALVHRLLQSLPDGRITPKQYLAITGNRSEPITGVTMLDDLIETWRPNVLPGPRDHAAILQYYTDLIEIAALPVEERVVRIKEREKAMLAQPSAVRTLLPASFKVAEADARKIASLRCAIAALAAERHRLATGRWPGSLAELMPEHVTAVPLDPFDAKPLRLKRLPDGLLIYSVGVDRTDDGGNGLRNAGPRPGLDLGFRLWDPAQRRQPPPPPPEVQPDP